MFHRHRRLLGIKYLKSTSRLLSFWQEKFYHTLRREGKGLDSIELIDSHELMIIPFFRSIHYRKGSIVYVSSIGGYQVLPAIGAYSISKTALLGLTKAIASECAGNNIRVNCVCPGVIETKFSQALTDNEGIKEEMLKQIPLHRIGKPEEIAGLVSFLCSDDSSYLTGESIAVAGGFFSRLWITTSDSQLSAHFYDFRKKILLKKNRKTFDFSVN